MDLHPASTTPTSTTLAQPTFRAPAVHPQYAQARARAVALENELDGAQKAYAAKLKGLIQKLQAQFYQKYGDQLYELEDLEHAIHNVQSQGQRALQRQLTALYLRGANEDQTGGGGNKASYQAAAKHLCEQFRATYCPADAYQVRRDAEAAQLQRAMMGGDGGFPRTTGQAGAPPMRIVSMTGDRPDVSDDAEVGGHSGHFGGMVS